MVGAYARNDEGGPANGNIVGVRDGVVYVLGQRRAAHDHFGFGGYLRAGIVIYIIHATDGGGGFVDEVDVLLGVGDDYLSHGDAIAAGIDRSPAEYAGVLRIGVVPVGLVEEQIAVLAVHRDVPDVVGRAAVQGERDVPLPAEYVGLGRDLAGGAGKGKTDAIGQGKVESAGEVVGPRRRRTAVVRAWRGFLVEVAFARAAFHVAAEEVGSGDGLGLCRPCAVPARAQRRVLRCVMFMCLLGSNCESWVMFRAQRWEKIKNEE